MDKTPKFAIITVYESHHHKKLSRDERKSS